MFIYLNRTGYNGLFRLNASGDFNVPAGRYVKPHICDADNLRQVSRALKNVCLECAAFERVLETAEPGDFFYFDPPYAPLSRTASFTSYTAGGFSLEQQQRLRQTIVALARRGCHVVLSNSTAREIAELYADDPEVAGAGIRCHEVPARRSINSHPGRRGAVTEYIITNVEAAS
jgi:DNA adenine methylase